MISFIFTFHVVCMKIDVDFYVLQGCKGLCKDIFHNIFFADFKRLRCIAQHVFANHKGSIVNYSIFRPSPMQEQQSTRILVKLSHLSKS